MIISLQGEEVDMMDFISHSRHKMLAFVAIICICFASFQSVVAQNATGKAFFNSTSYATVNTVLNLQSSTGTLLNFRTCEAGEILTQTGSNGDNFTISVTPAGLVQAAWTVGTASKSVEVGTSSYATNEWVLLSLQYSMGSIVLSLNSGSVVSETLASATLNSELLAINLSGTGEVILGRGFVGCIEQVFGLMLDTAAGYNVDWGVCPLEMQRGCQPVVSNPCYTHPCKNQGVCSSNAQASSGYSCQCTARYDGDICLIDTGPLCAGTNPVYSLDCQNGGVCLEDDIGNSTYCQCTSQFEGLLCELNVTVACDPNLCVNNGTCKITENGNECSCKPGFSGDTCAINIDECAVHQCLNRGQCIDGIDSYTCNCTDTGYTGDVCSQAINECDAQPCVNKVMCVDLSGGFFCQCLPGWTGKTCDTDIDECEPMPCKNGGTCTNLNNAYACQCAQGFNGNDCKVNIDDCVSVTCPPTFECMDGVASYSCQCPPGKVNNSGSCQDYDECSENPCQNGDCLNLDNYYRCDCYPGYNGTNCTIDIDECAPEPCRMNSTCVDGVNGFNCTCLLGYGGDLCDIDIDECLMGLCDNGALCQDGINSFTCNCAPGYEGDRCQNNTDDCAIQPCQNGATCVDEVNDYACNCLDGFVDKNCSTNFDECQTDPCQYSAPCVDEINDYFCNCSIYYLGKDCETPYDACDQEMPCKNGATCTTPSPPSREYSCECVPGFNGTECEINIDDCLGVDCNATSGRVCFDGVQSFRCDCPIGFEDPFCSVEIDECASDPCENNSTCHDNIGNFTCSCALGFTGEKCETDIDNCNPNPCQNGICIDEINKYQCYCVPGYSGNNCQHSINECDSNPCENDGTCEDILNKFICTCAPGYADDRCETNIDECESSPCENNSTCIDNINAFSCNCTPGFNGTLCEVDIDECASSPCNLGSCIDAVNNFTCNCTDTGFFGPQCEFNIDDCAQNPCTNDATCQDLIKDYNCSCWEGYTGKDCSVDINECLSSPCVNGSCLERSNRSLYIGSDSVFLGPFSYANASGFVCQCIEGYEGELCDIDIDECASGPCENNGTCVDGLNGYTCKCAGGWEGVECELEIDECAAGPCQNDASCTDLINDYVCVCTTEYAGKNCSVLLTGCNNNMCQNGATCLPSYDEANDTHSYTCQCAAGYVGQLCTTDTSVAFENESYLVDRSTNAKTTLDYSIDIATTLPDGILLYSSANTNFHFVLEMFNGDLYLTYSDPIAPTLEINDFGQLINDGEYHAIKVVVTDTEITLSVTVPQMLRARRTATCAAGVCAQTAPITNGMNILFGNMYIGGVNTDILSDWATYSRSKKFFTGCCRDIKNDGQYFSLPFDGAARVARAVPAGSNCNRVPQCQPDPCNSNGACTDLWNTFTCDCYIGYTNTTCNVEFIPATFRYEDTPESYAEFTADDALSESSSAVRLAFRTREPNGLMFFAQNANGSSYLTVELFSENLHVTFGRNGMLANISAGTGLSDGIYHSVSVTADQMNLKLNLDLQSTKPLTKSSTLQSGSTDFSKFSVGGVADFSQNIPADAILSNTYFKGCLWDVKYNNYSLQFEPLNLNDFPIPSFPLTTNMSVLINDCESDDTCADEPCENGGTCTVTWNDFKCDCPTGFGGKNCSDLTICAADPCPLGAECRDIPNGHECVVEGTFNGIDSLVTYTANISTSTPLDSITLRARSRNVAGIIFFAVNEDLGHYVSLYLDQGMPTVRFSLGETDEIKSQRRVDDGQWHEIKVMFSDTEVKIQVDEIFSDKKTYILSMSLSSVITQNGSSPLIVGGSKIVNTAYFINYNFFKGCLDDVRVGGFLLPFFTREIINSTSEEQFEASINEVRPGCVGDPVCNAYECGSFGTCIDLWNEAGCNCTPGFSGERCNINIDECELFSTCVVGSTCRDGINNYTCSCPLGYEGRNCEIETDECDPDQCLRGSQCYDGLGFFNCTCLDGYTGTYCDVLINNTCAGNPCKNGATCLNTTVEEIHFMCTCPLGFEDQDCGREIDYCLTNECTNGATCQREPPSYTCSCPAGFSGNRCQTNDDNCVGKLCTNRGNCVDGIDSYYCNCTKGYLGDNCETDIDECDSNPCQFGATCTNMIGDFSCTCAPGYNGRYCSTDINECENSVDPLCENGGSCMNTNGSYTCLCPLETWGPQCEIAPCRPSPCQNNAPCIPYPSGAYDCLCPLGYEGANCSLPNCSSLLCLNGGSCRVIGGSWDCECAEFVAGSQCQYKGPCASDVAPCINGGMCQQEFQDGGQFTYMCNCPIGFNGTNCELEINWCDSSPCQNAGSNCTSSRETFTCSCGPGYTGNICETKLPDCASNLCQYGATCTDLDYGYRCDCADGYEGTDCEIDINECAFQPCRNNGSCTDAVNAFICNCNETGYQGLNCAEDIDECLTLTTPCANNGSCSNTPGSYLCTCKEGWVHSDCSLPNPCVVGKPCKNGGTCSYSISKIDLQVDYECKCAEDYEGTICDKFTGTNTNWALIGGISGGALVLLVVIIVLAVVTVNLKSRRATQGTYSPSRQEISGSRVEMDNILKLPPEERLI